MKSKKHDKIFGLVSAVFWAGLLVSISNENCFGAQYKLAPGDTVEVSIGGLSDQRSRGQIQIDGTIALPGIGNVEVAGLTPSEMQNRIETLLQSKILRQRLPDGRDQTFVVKPGDVIAS